MTKTNNTVLKGGKKIYQKYSGGAQSGFTRLKLALDLGYITELDAKFADIEGQDYACQAIKEYAFGINRRVNAKSAGGVLLFAGAPGVGKTLMAERLAEALHRPFLRLDMSNHNDKESYCDVFGNNPSYKSAAAGYLTKFVDENPVCVLLFDELEKSHHNVRSRMLQIFEGGECRDLFMQKNVSFRDAIIIITTNVGKDIYNGNSLDFIFSGVPQSKIVRAMKTEKNPVDGIPYFSEALVSRLTSGKIIMFNKLRPEILHRIGVNEALAQIAYYNNTYKIKIDVDVEEFVNLVIYSQGGAADVRSVKKAVREFFEINVARIIKQADEMGKSDYVTRINCTISTDGMTKEAEAALKGPSGSRILVYASDAAKAAVESAAYGKTELIFVDDDFNLKALSKLDLSSAIIQSDRADGTFAKKLFEHIVGDGSIPVYVFAEGRALRSSFHFFTDGGATDIFSEGLKNISLEDWLKGIVKGVELSFVTQTLFRTNKVIRFESSYALSAASDVAELKISELDVTTAIDGADDGYFVGGSAVPNVRFDDVIGADDAKRELALCTGYLKNYKTYLRSGIRIPRGVLLDGAPGTGKTMLAKALAAEAGVPFIQKNATEFIVKWVGDGAQSVRTTFSVARKYAPCILFVDEIDAIAKSRESGVAGENRTDDIVNAFLSEMDGFSDNSSAPVLVVAATNFSTRRGETLLDEALLRRFDRKIHIELPDMASREKLITLSLKKLGAVNVTEERVKNIARRSIGWNLADLNLVVQNAARLSDDGFGNVNLTDEILNEAFESYTDGSAKIRTDAELEATAYHEAGHAVVATLLGFKPSYATITSRGGYGGYVYYGDENISVFTKEELLGRISVAFAGRVSEVCFFGERGINTGAQGDVKSATQIATRMVTELGMCDGSLMYFAPSAANSEWVQEKIQTLLREQYEKTVKIIENNKDKVRAVAEGLITHNSLDERALQEIMEHKEE